MKTLALNITLLLGGFAAFGAQAFEEEHPLSTIQGTRIDLKTEGHAIAGSLNGFLVLGNFDHDIGGSRITLARDDKRFEAEFKKNAEGKLGGLFALPFGDTQLFTAIELVKILPEQKQYLFKLNQKDLLVSVSSERFEHKHFIVPTFSATVNNEEVSFTLKGQASYGYAAHLIMMILSAHDFGHQYIFQSYKNLSSALAKYAKDNGEVGVMFDANQELMAMGLQLMRRYVEKNPSCAAQYEVIYQELAGFPEMELATADSRYHEGQGLPAAPRFCYFARALVVHPYLNQLRMKEGLTAPEREAVVEEFDEVARHIVKVKKNIDNPPNP